jgi:dTDP-4-amino-4,6-dideoxygalactose transaminase
MEEIMKLSRQHNLKVIEDCAQAPGAEYGGVKVGTLGDLAVFSLNYHKHIHTGEGGVITTNNSALANRCQLIRNHAEAVVGPKEENVIKNMFGFNFRMPEIEASIGLEQLKKLDELLLTRLKNVAILNSFFQKFEGLDLLEYDPENKHVYYIHPLLYDTNSFKGVTREKFLEAIKAELPSSILRETTGLIGGGYVKPLYFQPIYQQRAATCSFNCSRYKGQVDYSRGICPIAEEYHYNRLITHEYMRPGMSQNDLKDVTNAFEKVRENIDELI